jgi:hypothetical protein
LDCDEPTVADISPDTAITAETAQHRYRDLEQLSYNFHDISDSYTKRHIVYTYPLLNPPNVCIVETICVL